MVQMLMNCAFVTLYNEIESPYVHPLKAPTHHGFMR
jgi:hypothetical protein